MLRYLQLPLPLLQPPWTAWMQQKLWHLFQLVQGQPGSLPYCVSGQLSGGGLGGNGEGGRGGGGDGSGDGEGGGGVGTGGEGSGEGEGGDDGGGDGGVSGFGGGGDGIYSCPSHLIMHCLLSWLHTRPLPHTSGGVASVWVQQPSHLQPIRAEKLQGSARAS